MKILSIILASGVILLVGFMFFEPEMAKGVTATGEVNVTLDVTEGITLTVPTSNLTMAAITMTANSSTNATAGADWTVKTNSQDGWKLELNADNANCLASASPAEAWTDYTEATANTPEAWSVGSGAYEFGFNVHGTKITGGTGKWGTGTDCAAYTTNKLYQGFKSVTAISVGTDTTETGTSGQIIYLCVAAQQNTIYAPNASYTADITGTATGAQ